MRLAIYLLASLCMISLFGCDLTDSKFDDLKFDNASKYNVRVIPLTSEWSEFSLAPDEKKEFGSIDHPDFAWEPKDKVELSSSSTDREVVFVNRSIDFEENPTVIYVDGVEQIPENP